MCHHFLPSILKDISELSYTYGIRRVKVGQHKTDERCLGFIDICETLTENKGNMCLVDSGLPNIERLGQQYAHCILGDKVENSKYRSAVPSHDCYY